jgi:Response regulator containing CheY-like receiver domain and AraC-type DNA-binding domain
MKRYIQHAYLKVSHFVSSEWAHPVHNHNHFEIIFVHRGKGAHCLSGMHYAYDGPALFLLAPCDHHSFVIEEETEFSFLKFTNMYLQQQPAWNQEIDALLIQARQQYRPVVAEAEKMDALVRLIVREWKETKNESNETIFYLIQALLSMVRRQWQPGVLQTPQKHAATVTSLLHYLHTHIHSTERTQLEHLAARFHYSKNYLGIFFKDQTGMTLRDYVNRYKLHVMENRLQYSSLSIKEISEKLGFTDMSHFNKFFKAHKGVSPSVYRAQTGIKKVLD